MDGFTFRDALLKIAGLALQLTFFIIFMTGLMRNSLGDGDENNDTLIRFMSAPVAGLLIGVVTIMTAYAVSRFWRSNTVYGDTAVEAATPAAQRGSPASITTRKVTDRALREMATIRFEPPDDITPWQGRVLLFETIDGKVGDAFVAELVANGGLQITERPSPPPQPPVAVLERGSQFHRLDANSQSWIQHLLGADGFVPLASGDADYARTMVTLRQALRRHILPTGWWKLSSGWFGNKGPVVAKFRKTKDTPRHLRHRSLVWNAGNQKYYRVSRISSILGAIVFVATPISFLPLPLLLLVILGVGIIPVLLTTRRGVPSRTAEGSAYALQVEGFRRFLADSEQRHVEHAWEVGHLREFSAWAIALNEADAWVNELAASEQVRVDRFNIAPVDEETLRNMSTSERLQLLLSAAQQGLSQSLPSNPPHYGPPPAHHTQYGQHDSEHRHHGQ